MKKVFDFEKQLSNFDLEVTVIASYVYAEMAIQHAASESKELRSILNRTPTFWKTCFAALQSSAYIAIARVFDGNSPYNIDALMESMESNMHLFSKAELGKRKAASGYSDPSKLAEYMDKAHELGGADMKRIRRAVERRRLFFDKAILHVRHRYLAHRQTHGSTNVQELYGRGKVKEMWLLSCFLHHLHVQLWSLYHNGHKPNLRVSSRYSPKVMYNEPQNLSRPNSGPHERIVREVRTLMKMLEASAKKANAP